MSADLDVAPVDPAGIDTAGNPLGGPEPSPAAPAAPKPGDGSPQGGGDPLSAAQAEVETWKRRARQWEDRSKANHAEVQARDGFLRTVADKLGIEFGDKPDPGQLAAQLDTQRRIARERTTELAVHRAAGTAGASATALLDSREFMDQANRLDHDAPDFPGQLAELVSEAAKQPRWQAATGAHPASGQSPASGAPTGPPAPASGADFGTPGGNRLWTQADYDAATRPGADPAALIAAIDKGLLVNLGIGKPKSRNRR